MCKLLRRRRPSAALIISCLALFMALGGVSYGFAAGSINSKEIKNNDVRSKDVRQSTLTGADVKGNALKGADIDEPSLGKVPAAVTPIARPRPATPIPSAEFRRRPSRSAGAASRASASLVPRP